MLVLVSKRVVSHPWAPGANSLHCWPSLTYSLTTRATWMPKCSQSDGWMPRSYWLASRRVYAGGSDSSMSSTLWMYEMKITLRMKKAQVGMLRWTMALEGEGG
jgi:hypothetical protein